MMAGRPESGEVLRPLGPGGKMDNLLATWAFQWLNSCLWSSFFVAELFKALQMEVTSRCNASCAFCPRTILRDMWLSKDMDIELFTRIIDEIGHGLDLVYLQGWGEPLLNPNVVNMIRRTKKKLGVAVGLTTNGTLLGESVARDVLDAGLDVIGISFAGADAETHNELRQGCDFNCVVGNATTLARLKELAGSGIRVIASYMMTRQNIHQIPRFVALCKDLGIGEITFNNLTYMPSKALYASKAFSCHGEKLDGGVKDYIEEAKKLADNLGVKMFAYGTSCSELAVCPEDPLRTMFVNVDGEISSCVYTNIPTRDSKVPRYFAARQLHTDKLVFGSVDAEGLYDTWNEGEYRLFREAFGRRTRAVGDASELLSLVLESAASIALPECCKTCYRILGV